MIKSENFQFSDSISFEDQGNGIQRQIYGYDDTIMLVKAKFETGAIAESHSHFHAQVTYVESGRFKITIDGVAKILSKGDGFYVPPHAIHGGECLEAGMLIDVFSPLREDFLPEK